MVNDHDDDGEGAKKIETGLALARGKARVDSEFSRASLRPEGRFVLSGKVANGLECSSGPEKRNELSGPVESGLLATGVLNHGQGEPETAAVSEFTLHTDLPEVGLNGQLAKGEP